MWRILLLALCLILMPGSTRADSLADQLVNAAFERTKHSVTYDGRYVSIDYPGGDVPDSIGVCTDLVIRAYRQLGIDLQQLVHQDMTLAFSDYPDHWGLTRPDSNIDHRRVPNLQTFLPVKTQHYQSRTKATITSLEIW